MAKSKCIITFDSPNKVFLSGEMLCGQILLTLHEEKAVRAITLKITGKAHCSWNDNGNDSSTYSGQEYYLNEKFSFQADGNGPAILPPGLYSYPFEFVLPPDIPTSLKATHGYVRYCAKTKIEIPMWRDLRAREEFTIVKPLNLNDCPHLRNTLELVSKKTFFWCCLFCCCSSKHLYMIGRIPSSGYCPGDVIPLEMRIINDSKKPIRNFKINLAQVFTYQPNKKRPEVTHSDVKNINTITRRGCAVDANEQYIINVVIPPTIPTDTTSSICKLEYALIITGSVSGCHEKPTLKIPVIIGTSPFIYPHDSDYLRMSQFQFQVTERPESVSIIDPMETTAMTYL